MANEFLYGSICLSKIPKRLIKTVKCKDGEERLFLDIKIVKRKEVSQFGHTHYISCEPKDQNDRKEDENYFIGDIKEYNAPQQQSAVPNAVPIEQSAPTQQSSMIDQLPF